MKFFPKNRFLFSFIIISILIGCFSSCIPISKTMRATVTSEFADPIEETETSSIIVNATKEEFAKAVVDDTTTAPITEKGTMPEIATTAEPITAEISTTIEIIMSGSDDFEIEEETNIQSYILNIYTKKFHYTWCQTVKQMRERDKWEITCTRNEVTAMGYKACKICNP